MNNSYSTPEFPNFPIEEFTSELEQENNELKSAIQELSTRLLTQLKEQNPELMDAKIIKQNDIQLSIILGRRQANGILLEFHRQVRDVVLNDMLSRVEKAFGKSITLDEVTGMITISLSDMKKFNQMEEDYIFTVTRGIQTYFLNLIDEFIPEDQTTRPDIRFFLYVPDHCGAQMFIYHESNGIVFTNDVFKPPTVTLDTNVVRGWWENRSKVEHVEKILKLGQKFEIDLAVTRRIHADVPKQPLAEKIKELPDLLIYEIGAIIRPNNWHPGIDTIGITEFVDFIDSIEVSDEFNNMNIKKRPDSRDWDHIHTHYRYGRNYFLTWDNGILHFAKKFKDFGINIMKPEEYLSQHQPTIFEEWVKEKINNTL